METTQPLAPTEKDFSPERFVCTEFLHDPNSVHADSLTLPQDSTDEQHIEHVRFLRDILERRLHRFTVTILDTQERQHIAARSPLFVIEDLDQEHSIFQHGICKMLASQTKRFPDKVPEGAGSPD